jgi:hypothetical protein
MLHRYKAQIPAFESVAERLGLNPKPKAKK